MSVRISMSGNKELEKVFVGLKSTVQDNILKNAHTEAAKPLVNYAKAIVQTGETLNLKKSIGVTRVPIKRAGEIGVVQVGPRRGGQYKGYHGHLLEYGKTNRDGTRSRVFAFMKPAFIATQRNVEKMIAFTIGSKIAQYIIKNTKNG